MIPASECPEFDLKVPPDLDENQLPQRKHPRLKEYDYSQCGCYFITLCTKDRARILSRIIVGRDDLIPPKIELTPVGNIVDEYIQSISLAYPTVSVDCYVIMPDHIHLLLTFECDTGGGMRSSRPTLPLLVRAFKGMITRRLGKAIWQASFYDHVIRSEKAYQEIWQYIENNPAQWEEDHSS